MAGDIVRVSKFLSLILRHDPGRIGLNLDSGGWAIIEELIRLSDEHGTPLTRHLLERVVSGNDKQRFAFSDDGLRIRAIQGHSVEVDLALPASSPPESLYHGTASRFLESIQMQGLHSGNRLHVHLSADVATAIKVGQRHGKVVVLEILSGKMAELGYNFFLSANGVWLTEKVPIEFICFPVEPK